MPSDQSDKEDIMAASSTGPSQASADTPIRSAAVSTAVPTAAGVIRLTRRNTSATFAIQQNN